MRFNLSTLGSNPGQLAALAALIAIVAFGALTQARSQGEEKKPTLKEAVTRINNNRVRINRGFEFRRVSDSRLAVFRVVKPVKVGEINCSACAAGGDCTTIKTGDEVSCGNCSRGCLIDPF